MSKDRFYELLAKKKSGSISLIEQKELMALIKNNPEYHSLAHAIEVVFNLDMQMDLHEGIDSTAHWERLKESIVQQKSSLSSWRGGRLSLQWLRWSAVAACFALLTIAAYLFFTNTEKGYNKQNVVSTKTGSRSNVVLPDGTQVWLNADSKITYNEDFDKQTRAVTLTGEAYFDVVKDALHPFVIHTKAIVIKVLGTAFNVRAYDNEKSTETTLIRGSVEVSLNSNTDRKIVLKPNEKLSVHNDFATHVGSSSKPVPAAVSTETLRLIISDIKKIGIDSSTYETSWMKNKLSFNNKTLEEVALQLGRWYGVEVIIVDSSLANKKYTAIFEDETLTQVLEALKLTGGFSYTMDKKKVFIRL